MQILFLSGPARDVDDALIGQLQAAGGESRRGATLKLTTMGYGARCPAEAPGVALSARRCHADLIVRGEQGWRAELEVVFSAFAEGGRRPWTWADGT